MLLRREGATSVERFNLLQEEDFKSMGIDIAARRAEKKAANEAEAAARAADVCSSAAATANATAADTVAAALNPDRQCLVSFLQTEGATISAAGQEQLKGKVGLLTTLCELNLADLAGAQAAGLNVVDARVLVNLLGASPTIKRLQEVMRVSLFSRGLIFCYRRVSLFRSLQQLQIG